MRLPLVLCLHALAAGVARADDLPKGPPSGADPAHEEPPSAQRAATEPPPPAPEERATPGFRFEAKPGYGISIGTNDERYSMNIRARIQVRANWDIGQPDDAGERETTQLWNIGTARLYIGGNLLSKDLKYLIQLAVAGRDFRDVGNPSPIYDAYLEYKVHQGFHIKAGQFFVPFDRLRTVREFALQLPDRPRPISELTLDRDVGVDLYSPGIGGKNGIFGYHAAIMGGGGINLVTGKEPGALFVGRVELRPLGPIDDDSEGDLARRKKPGLMIGGAVAYNLHTNRARSTTGAFFVGDTVNYLHGAADLVFKWRGFALQAEYVYRKGMPDAFTWTDPDGTPVVEYTRSGQGVIVQASYCTSIDLEAAARFSKQWALSDATDPRYLAEVDAKGNEVSAGLSYYLNGHRLKVQAGWTALFGDAFDRAEHLVNVLVDATF